VTEPADTIHLDGYKLARSVTSFHRADHEAIWRRAGVRTIWRRRIGPYILTLTKNVEPSTK
jgi:hypothetical protein